MGDRKVEHFSTRREGTCGSSGVRCRAAGIVPADVDVRPLGRGDGRLAQNSPRCRESYQVLLWRRRSTGPMMAPSKPRHPLPRRRAAGSLCYASAAGSSRSCMAAWPGTNSLTAVPSMKVMSAAACRRPRAQGARQTRGAITSQERHGAGWRVRRPALRNGL